MRYEPIVAQRIDRRITDAKCSCGQALEMPNVVLSARERERALKVAFSKHVKEKHPGT